MKEWESRRNKKRKKMQPFKRREGKQGGWKGVGRGRRWERMVRVREKAIGLGE